MEKLSKSIFLTLLTVVLFILQSNAVNAQLNTAGEYVWHSTDAPKVFNGRFQLSFVSSNEGFPNYGTVLAGGGLSNTEDGSAFQIYFPYNSTYGGIAPQVRLGLYNNAGWSSWNTFFTSANANSSTVDWATKNLIAYGNIGIGTSVPLSKLHVEEHASRTLFTGAGIGTAIIRNETGNLNYSMPDFSGGSSNVNAQSRIASLQTASGSFLQFGTSNNYASGITNTAMTIDYLGNVGLGITTPGATLDVNGTTYSRKLYVGTPDANTKTYMGTNDLLAVNGTAVFVKAKVAVYGGNWPDYVFAPTYHLTPLDSLEQFIKLNKHLPELPSAKEVEKDGIDLGSNQALLLKKIEELTLIVIDQNKQIQLLKKTVEGQKKKTEEQ